ncbi:MAG: hypothetical protein WCG98_05215 [bacterium]
MKNKEFCIFNKEYSKEDWFELANKIFEKMDIDGILGKSFPGDLNPFYFNDTAAYLIDDTFTKDEVEKEGFLRRDEAVKTDIPTGADVIEVKDLSSYQRFTFA